MSTSTTLHSHLNPPWEGDHFEKCQVNFSAQDSDVGQVGGGVDLLNSEARHGGAGVWLRGFNNIFQVPGREN